MWREGRKELVLYAQSARTYIKGKASEKSGLKKEVIPHLGGLSSGWVFIGWGGLSSGRVVFHQRVFHQAGWSFIIRVFHHTGWSYIQMVFHQGQLSSDWSIM